jgi:hypothetical protein
MIEGLDNIDGRTEQRFLLLETAAIERGMQISGDKRVSEVNMAKLLSLSLGTLRNMRTEGKGPPAFAVGMDGSRVSYGLRDVARWIEERKEIVSASPKSI